MNDEMMSKELSVTVQHSGAGCSVAAVSGELDWDTAPILSERAQPLISSDAPHLVLDLSGVPFCDSSGLNALIGLWRTAQAVGGSLRLVAVPARLARQLRTTALDTLMPTYASVADNLGRPSTPDTGGPA